MELEIAIEAPWPSPPDWEALALRAAKTAVDRGLEVDLRSGLEFERQQFASLFATHDRTIGMGTFLESGPGQATFEGR